MCRIESVTLGVENRDFENIVLMMNQDNEMNQDVYEEEIDQDDVVNNNNDVHLPRVDNRVYDHQLNGNILHIGEVFHEDIPQGRDLPDVLQDEFLQYFPPVNGHAVQFEQPDNPSIINLIHRFHLFHYLVAIVTVIRHFLSRLPLGFKIFISIFGFLATVTFLSTVILNISGDHGVRDLYKAMMNDHKNVTNNSLF